MKIAATSAAANASFHTVDSATTILDAMIDLTRG